MNDSSSTVLIFPASYYQLDLFRAAQDLNYRIATFDYAADNPGHQMADVSQIIDVRDLDTALAFARAQNISAVCSACSDVSLAALAHISHGLGFAGPSPEMIETLTSKINFRRWQAQFGNAPIAFVDLSTPHLSGAARAALPARVVIKPDIASGSKGIYICDRDEVSDALLETSSRESLNGCIVIEQCVTGEHYTFEGFLHEGAFVFQMCTARLRNPKDQVGTVGHIFPSGLSASVQDQLMLELRAIFAHFGYQNGPVDCDFVVSGDQVSILEVTPRLGGNAISKLASASFGISLPDYYLRSQLGLPLEWPDLPYQIQHFCQTGQKSGQYCLPEA